MIVIEGPRVHDGVISVGHRCHLEAAQNEVRSLREGQGLLNQLLGEVALDITLGWGEVKYPQPEL